MLGYNSYSSFSFIRAVHNGDLEDTKKLIDSYGLPHSSARSEEYVLLCNALKEDHAEVVHNQDKGVSNYDEDVLKHCLDVNNQNNGSSLKTALFDNGENNKKVVGALRKYGFTISPEDANNPKLLHAAVGKGYLKIVEDLLQYGADINALDESENKNFTPLHSAVKNKQEEVAKLLISYGADINAQDKIGQTPLMYAVKKEWIEIVEDFLQHDVDINSVDYCGKTALHFTALSNLFNGNNSERVKGKLAKLLLNKVANVNSQTKNGETTLHVAARKGYAKVVEALLEHDANVNCEIKPDVTPLHLSAGKGNEEITKMLLLKGANVNATQKNGTSALHIATRMGHKSVVKVLLDFGADVNSTMKSDITPLHISAKAGTETVTEVRLSEGANVDGNQNYRGTTALHIASQKGYTDIVNTLLECGSIVDSKRDTTPLHLGVQHDRENFETVLKFGVDINSRDEDGRTALHLASKFGHGGIVEALLEYGFDINATSIYNETPLDLADARGSSFLSFGFPCVIKVLRCHIAKLIAANLFVSEKNLKLYFRNRYGISDFLEKCKEEIVSMKSEKIYDANISFYDILTKDEVSLAMCMRNEKIVHVLKFPAVYEAKFPMYASMIKSLLRKGMKSKELREQSNKIFNFLFPELPDDCVEKIFSYLSAQDMRIFLTAFKDLALVNLKVILMM